MRGSKRDKVMRQARTLEQYAADLGAGRTSSRALVDACLDRIGDPAGEGDRVFLKVHEEQARAAAENMDRARSHGFSPSRFAGIPVSVKDLFDVAGDVTRAASKVLEDDPPATADAVVVARLRAAGFVVIGRTNMTEFAYSVTGLNTYFGTPLNPWDRAVGRVPGGSSSGAVVSVTDGMAALALGSDSGGSCRSPAALSGIVGFKPTTRRVPNEGMVLLSPSTDVAGPIGASVSCCAIADAILTGQRLIAAPEPLPVQGLRLAVPQTLVLDDLDMPVALSFERALTKLSEAGAKLFEISFPELAEIWESSCFARLAGVEAYALHRHRLAQEGDRYDPLVRHRFDSAKGVTAADYIDVCRQRADFIERAAGTTAPYDAAAWPTAPIVAPPLADLEDIEAYGWTNRAILRNTSPANFLDRTAISIPCHEPGSAPVGLMLIGEALGDRRLLAIAQGIEDLFRD